MARILIIGGTGNISQHTVRVLAERGHALTLLNRTKRTLEQDLPPNVSVIADDRDRSGAVTEAVARARPDCVMDFVCFTPAQAEALISACRGRAAHVVFVSTVDTYGYPLRELPVSEGARRAPAVGSYAAHKQRCEDLLSHAAAEGAFELTITRPTYCLGRSFVASFVDFDARHTLRRIREGRPVLLPGDGFGRMHASTARDCGRMHAELPLAPQAFGRVFNTGSDEGAITHRRYLEALGKLGGRDPVAVPVPKVFLKDRFGSDLEWGIWGLVMQFDMAFDLHAFARAFPSFRWENDLEAGLRPFLARVEAEGGFKGAPADDDLESRILREWSAGCC